MRYKTHESIEGNQMNSSRIPILERQVIKPPLEQIEPEPASIFRRQGIPDGVAVPERVRKLYDDAETIFYRHAAPMGIVAGITHDDFAAVYRGNERNEPDTPLQKIFPQARHLALMAFTLGPAISREIQARFDGNGLALGYMLDSIASYCADKAGDAAAKLFREKLTPPEKERSGHDSRTLLYSPGYCGWHVSGQGKLFEYLKPEDIGISLNESYLMIPLKSISGVLVTGDKKIHQFKNSYPFCALCKTRNCRERMTP
jgi:hypothetical protein